MCWNRLRIPLCTFTVQKAGGQRTCPLFLSHSRATGSRDRGPWVQITLLSHCLIRWFPLVGLFMGINSGRNAFPLSDCDEWHYYSWFFTPFHRRRFYMPSHCYVPRAARGVLILPCPLTSGLSVTCFGHETWVELTESHPTPPPHVENICKAHHGVLPALLLESWNEADVWKKPQSHSDLELA